jgi:hypothetical protein
MSGTLFRQSATPRPFRHDAFQAHGTGLLEQFGTLAFVVIAELQGEMPILPRQGWHRPSALRAQYRWAEAGLSLLVANGLQGRRAQEPNDVGSRQGPER